MKNLNKKYIVLYNSSAKDANATIVKRSDIDLEFIVESKGYSYMTDNVDEAYYLCAILNAQTPNLIIKDFQTRGLFGARDIHKKILDVWFPEFDGANTKHQQLAQVSKTAHEKVSGFLAAIPPDQKVEGIQFGRIRREIKKHLAKEMKEMDEEVRGGEEKKIKLALNTPSSLPYDKVSLTSPRSGWGSRILMILCRGSGRCRCI